MKIHPEHVALALLEMAEKLPASEIPALADAAVAYLRERRESRMVRMLPRLLREARGKHGKTVSIVLTTPTGDLGASRRAMLEALEKLSGREAELEEQADPSLLGGAVLAYGDERFDASLRGALDRLQSDLTMVS
ncbi:MAG: F0F1 ATP synthase subunit delta [Patescibacteria group bacterium]